MVITSGSIIGFIDRALDPVSLNRGSMLGEPLLMRPELSFICPRRLQGYGGDGRGDLRHELGDAALEIGDAVLRGCAVRQLLAARGLDLFGSPALVQPALHVAWRAGPVRRHLVAAESA